jgi:hypothetical protein
MLNIMDKSILQNKKNTKFNSTLIIDKVKKINQKIIEKIKILY